MSRNIGATNEAQVDSSHIHDVVLAKLEFDTPVYVHTGIGDISYGGNTYLGVGKFGGISATRESETVGPAQISLTLSGIESSYITEALDSGNLYDPITIYQGYRQDDGTLYADPWIVWKGWFEYASISLADESTIAIIGQHDLSQLTRKDGSRYSDEDQQSKYASDVGFEFVAEMAGVTLIWGGGSVSGAAGLEPDNEPAPKDII